MLHRKENSVEIKKKMTRKKRVYIKKKMRE